MSETQLLHIFGGKGGAGKTTLAAAFAMNLAEGFPKDKVLLVSPEPVRSLSDLLKKKFSAEPSKVIAGKGSGGLFVAELEGKVAVEPFLKKCRSALLKAVGHKGALLSEEDVTKLFEQSLVGLEEVGGLLFLAESLEDKSYDRVVVDTSATSHALRWFDELVGLRRLVALARGEKLGAKVGAKKEVAVQGGPLDEVAAQLDRVQALLKDPVRTAFHLVALAEPAPEAQTRMLFNALRTRGIAVSEVLVNQIEDDTGCSSCQGRRGLQAPHVRKFQQLDKLVPVVLLPKKELAPRGLDGVKAFAKDWAMGKESKALEFSAAEGPPALVRAPSMPPIAAPPLPPTRLIFFVGHGGVGKSSCAAAAAVTLTEKEGPVLLISADPAHSLSDVLQSRLTDTETQVKGTKGLYARELDTAVWFTALRKRLREKAEKAFPAEVKGQEVSQDRELLRNLIDAAPQGLEELPALWALTDALVQERFKRIVVDPMPATDEMRLLELPERARAWITSIQAVVGKYKAKGLGELDAELTAMLKHLKRFEDALASPTEARFVVVTRGEDLAVSRTERLVEYLQSRKVPVERVLVNRVLPKTACEKCENRRKNELLAAKALEKKLGLPITVAPALGRHPAGLRELKAFRTAWYALSATAKIKAA